MSNLNEMKNRLHLAGGDSDGRNVKSKLKSMQSALNNSYQAEWITYRDQHWRCLINPDKLKENYDQKEISIEFDAQMGCGSVFYWDRTDSYWIVYLQRLEEEAYFRAQIRKCEYEIDINGNPYHVYLRGPVETALIWRQKHQIEMNDLNYSILFYITKNEETNNFFKRFQILKFDGHNWRVAAVDRYSQEGIIEVYLEEYFDNEMEDKMIPPEIIKPDTTEPYIDGPQLIKPWDTNIVYSIVDAINGSFVVDSSKVKIVKQDETSCVLDVLTGKSTDFNLTYKTKDMGDIVLPIKVQSL